MSSENLAEQIGKAWRYEREGKTREAITEYERILKQDADNIDANYGMGLAQRAAGQKEEALKYFQKALALVESASARRRQVDSRIDSEGQPLITTTASEDDRNAMLIRMTQQRVDEIHAGLK